MTRTVNKILHFSDVHLNISWSLTTADSAVMPFFYGQDAPLKLLESALKYAQQMLPQPDLFLYTGDHVVHGIYSDAYVAKAVEMNVQTMQRYFSPNDTHMLEVTTILGNSDANPNYYMELTNPDSDANPMIAKVSSVWNDTLSTADFDHFNHRGYLSYELGGKLLVLTLNTVPYASKHTPNTQNVEDPFGQFTWLETTLESLKKTGKFAYITGHIPPIVDSFTTEPQWQVSYIEQYKKIVGKYPDVVKAQLFGHVQSVEMRVSPTKSVASSSSSSVDDSFQLVPLFLSGSISPYFINNPSFIVWDYDAETYEMLDFTVYGTHILEAEQKLNWQPLFKGSEAYGLKSLTTSDLTEFYERAKTNSTLLNAYYANMHAQSKRFEPCTTALCRVNTLCAMKWWSTKGEYLACVDGVQSSIRDTPAPAVDKNTSAQNVNSSNEQDKKAHDGSVAIGMIVFAVVVVVVVAAVIVRRLRRARTGSDVSDQRDVFFESISPIIICARESGNSMHV